ncbi:high mobility group protein B2-like isoform X1 [Mytilus californianus]|uniref:high mobility group protein B2-like isoform X1 n=1 Tax=Mytilus californianus TaxID=6549 RepID=UPI002246EB0E|nr:high mobility group protein B2-like isoform X1 [Mytilus californianus]XP_052077808.1 high mobility group protein B2-like isoform X1 [Mytilus californianus]
MGRKDGKPRGRMSSYAFFVQTCREEHKKKHPTEKVVFAEFTKKCAEKWKEMSAKEKKRFEDMAEKDKVRYEGEMKNYVPGPGEKVGRKKREKDPNAPKRSLSAFFFFCNEERPKVRKDHGDWSVAQVAKEMGKRWEKVTDRSKYEQQAAADKIRYEQAMVIYRGGGASPAKKPAGPPAKKPKPESEEEEDDDEEEEEDDDEDDDE